MMHETPSIVVFTSRAADPHRRALETALLDALGRRAGLTVLVAPHAYDLAPDGPVVAALRAIDGDLVALGWMASRAMHALLDQFGVNGARGTAAKRADSSSSRTIWCVDLDQCEDVEACLARIEPLVAGVAGGVEPAGPRRIAEKTRERWYPVIDGQRCVNCLECLNFCLFGVFGLDGSEKVLVEQPDACRPGCPACARVCPAGAIVFPECPEPTIAGRADPPPARRPSRRADDDLDRLVDDLDDDAL
ncbi:MAG: ferredoxin family protein [Pirellulales bacterium]|nr:ferredoxin family protein [Pirellulales bacterium]